MDQQEGKSKFDRAGEMFRQGDVQGALALLNELDAAYPENARILQAKQQCFNQLAGAGPTSSPATKHMTQATGVRNRQVWLVAGGVVALILVVAVFVLGRNAQRDGATGLVISNQATTIPSTNAANASAPSVSSTVTADNPYSRLPVHEEQVGPGSYACPVPREQLVSMSVPEPLYPDGKCMIWVPSETARKAYLEHATFVPSSVVDSVAKATPADVVKDTSKYGYCYSPKPPAFVPELLYEDEKPIYPFVGQKVPGTDNYLVDFSPDGNVVPALTTIDFRDFRSTNWPRDRYMGAIESVRQGRANFTLSGYQKAPSLTVNGVVHVTGDYAVWEQQKMTISPGTIMVMEANKDSVGIDIDPEICQGRPEVFIQKNGTLNISGTQQRPTVVTSSAPSPQCANWASIIDALGSNTPGIEYTLAEYGYWNWAMNNGINYAHNISRHTELPSAPPVAEGVFVANSGLTINNSEFHNNSISIHSYAANVKVQYNLIYENRVPISAHGHRDVTKGIMFDFERGKAGEIVGNVVVHADWGIACEMKATDQCRISRNCISSCEGAVVLYDLSRTTRPIIGENLFGQNLVPISGQYTDNISQGHVIFKETDYPDNQWNVIPSFRNLAIRDYSLVSR